MSCNCDDNPLILPIGPEGPQGPIGLTGPQGIQGPIGPQGPAGPAGNSIEFSFNYNNIASTAETGNNPLDACFFRFPGTISFGNPATVKTVITANLNGHNTGAVTLYNVTAGNTVIAVGTVSSATALSILNLTISGTFPTAEAIFKVELELTDPAQFGDYITLRSIDLSV